MTPDDLGRNDLSEYATGIASRAISPVELTKLLIQRCERIEPHINAFIRFDAEGALDSARHAETEVMAGRYRGALHGIPIAIKDLFWIRGVPTTAGSRTMAGFVPTEDAAVIERLRQAGAIIVGKTNLPEFAYSPCDQYHPEYGPTHNPWDLDRFPGASSSGSAAAVSARIVPVAIGSDTGGSVRTPAAFCGVTGFKPTFGVVSFWGGFNLAPSLDHVGLLGQSALDCAVLLELLAGFDARDPASQRDADRSRIQFPLHLNVKGLRVGVLDGLFALDLQPAVRAAVDAALITFTQMGADVRSVVLPDFETDLSLSIPILKVEASFVHEHTLAEHRSDLVPDVRTKLEEGLLISGVEYVRALQARRRVRATLQQALSQVDVLVSPTCDTTAPRMAPDGRVLDPPPYLLSGRPSGRIAFNIAGLPAVSIPCGADELGLPVGLQIAGREFEDAVVLSAADAFQAHTAWHHRRPPIDQEEL